MFKTFLLVVGNENLFRAVFIFFISFWLFWPTFSFFAVWWFCHFYVSFQWNKRFKTVLVKKNGFFCQKNFVLLFGHENSFQAVFSVLLQFLTFLTNFEFLCCWAVIVVFKQQVLADIKAVRSKKNYFSSEKLCFDISSKKNHS